MEDTGCQHRDWRMMISAVMNQQEAAYCELLCSQNKIVISQSYKYFCLLLLLQPDEGSNHLGHTGRNCLGKWCGCSTSTEMCECVKCLPCDCLVICRGNTIMAIDCCFYKWGYLVVLIMNGQVCDHERVDFGEPIIYTPGSTIWNWHLPITTKPQVCSLRTETWFKLANIFLEQNRN